MVKIICNNYLLYALMGVFGFGVLSRLILVMAYNSLKRSTYSMKAPGNKLLKQIRLKYESYDKLDFPVTNAIAFTKRALYEYRVCGLSLRFLEKLLGQAMFWCMVIGVMAVGCGYFYDIAKDIVVLYGVSAALFSILLYNIDKVSDIAYARENIEMSIVDFLENHVHERFTEEEEVMMQAVEGVEDEVKELAERTIAAGPAVEASVVAKEDKRAGQGKLPAIDENMIIEEVLNEIFC